MTSNWDDLPLEMQGTIVRYSPKDTRNALKVCSSKNKNLVERTIIRKVDRLQIGCPEIREGVEVEKWIINIHKFKKSYFFVAPESLSFDSFEEFQETLTQILKSVHSINHLIITNLKANVPLNLSSSNVRSSLLVENLNITKLKGSCEGQLENIISQVEPFYLSEIALGSDGGNSKIYDMKQVIFAERVKIGKSAVVREDQDFDSFGHEGIDWPSSIRQDQLMRLRARCLSLHPKCSVLKYVFRCANTVSAGAPPQLRFDGSTAYNEIKSLCFPFRKTITIETEKPKISLQLTARKFKHLKEYSVDSNIVFKSEKIASMFSPRDPFEPRTIRKLRLQKRSFRWQIFVTRGNYSEYEFKFKSFAGAQAKMDQILKLTDIIEKLIISTEKTDKVLTWKPRNKQLVVAELYVYGDITKNSIYQLLEQIDPVFIRKLNFATDGRDDGLFDIPHIKYASHISTSGSILRDEHLLKINSQLLNSVEKRTTEHQNKLLSANALNKYMKKCLLDSDERCHVFVFHKLSPKLDEGELFDGFDYIGRLVIKDGEHKLITLPESERALEVVYCRGKLVGVKRKVDEKVWNIPLLLESYYLGCVLAILPRAEACLYDRKTIGFFGE